jgi:hypothetical protein
MMPKKMKYIIVAAGFCIFAVVLVYFILPSSSPWGPNTYIASVASNAMKHTNDNWKNYFLDQGIDPSAFPLQNGFGYGDSIVIERLDSSEITNLQIGEVIIFNVTESANPLAHRIVDKHTDENGQLLFTTKGDCNIYVLQFEQSIKPEQIIGRVISVL